MLNFHFIDPSQRTVHLVIMGIGLFTVGMFSTFTLVPMYKVLMNSLDIHFDSTKYSKTAVIDKVSALIVLLKSVC